MKRPGRPAGTRCPPTSNTIKLSSHSTEITPRPTHEITIGGSRFSVAVLALFSLFGHSEVHGWFASVMMQVTRAGSALAGFLVVYLITLVAAALKTFNEAVTVLKA